MEKKKKLGLKTEPPKDTFCTRGYSRSQKKLTGFFCLLFREKKNVYSDKINTFVF